MNLRGAVIFPLEEQRETKRENEHCHTVPFWGDDIFPL
jgi:hypothetical protein